MPKQKYIIPKDFKEICEELDYDPSRELIVRRNELVEEADNYEALAEEEACKDEPDQELIDHYLSLEDDLRNHAERIDHKLMPYLYGRKTSHSLQGEEGTSLLDAFAQVALSNIPKKTNGAGKTKH